MSEYETLKEPLVTIGVPIKNRAHIIREVLRAVENLEYPREKVKLVFVDDYSTDGTFEILKEWEARIKKSYYDVVLIQQRTNIPQARNLCIKNMDGDFILFWDSDVIPPKDLLKQIVDVLESNNRVGIIGADYESLYGHDNISARILGDPVTNKATHAVYMGFTLIRREVFERVGGFNESLDIGEDTEICIRVVEKTDYKIMWAPRPVLHLEAVGETEKFKQGFLLWLSYNFQSRGEQYAKSFRKLPLLLRLRIFYYALLPPVLISILLLTYSTGAIWMPLLFITYLLPGLSLAVHGSNIKRGTILFFKLNIPTGVALSYGVLICFFKKLLKK